MKKLAIFDLDGTLLDTIADLSTACNVALEAFHYPVHPIEAYKHFVGSGIYKLVERALPEGKKDEAYVKVVKAVFDAYYAEHSLDQTAPYEGILEALKVLKEKGVQCVVVSNKAHPYTVDLVERFFGTFIEKALGQREGIPVKPNPQSVLELIESFEVSKKECIYIGDSDIDMLTAKNAGIASIGVVWGFRGEEELRAAGATYLAQDTKELVSYIVNE